MTYAIFNPIPWILFLLGVLLCVGSVKAFHRKYPQYPFGQGTVHVQSSHGMDAVSSLNVGISHDSATVEGLGR